MTLKHRRQFTREFKLQVLAEITAGKSLAQAAREHQLSPTLINRWQKQLRQYPKQAFSGNGRAYTDEARLAELERMVGRLTMENDLLKKALQRLAAQPHVPDPDLELRDHIQQIALEWPQYGYRRITAELHRQGIAANHKRVLRL